jgi:hypothetical protein
MAFVQTSPTRYLNVDHIVKLEVDGSALHAHHGGGQLSTLSFGSQAAAEAYALNLAEAVGLVTVD